MLTKGLVSSNLKLNLSTYRGTAMENIPWFLVVAILSFVVFFTFMIFLSYEIRLRREKKKSEKEKQQKEQKQEQEKEEYFEKFRNSSKVHPIGMYYEKN